MVHSKNYVSTKASKEIIPFQLEFPTWKCDSNGLPESKKNSTIKLTPVIVRISTSTPTKNPRLLVTPTLQP